MPEIFCTFVITLITTFTLTALYSDTRATSFRLAEQACNERASGSHVASFDVETATCDNGVTLSYQNKK